MRNAITFFEQLKEAAPANRNPFVAGYCNWAIEILNHAQCDSVDVGQRSPVCMNFIQLEDGTWALPQ